MNEINQHSVITDFNLASARAAVWRLLRTAAAGVAARGRHLRGALAILGFVTSALLLCATLLIAQVLIVGGLDRLRISPQYSFLTLNLLSITALAISLFYPALTRNYSRHRVFADSHSKAAEIEASVSLRRDPICKLLIVRRLVNRKFDTQALQMLQKGDNEDDIPVQNSLRGS